MLLRAQYVTAHKARSKEARRLLESLEVTGSAAKRVYKSGELVDAPEKRMLLDALEVR